jgi:hypothetical protein
MGTCKLRAFRDEWLLTRVRLMPLLDVKVVLNSLQQGGQFIVRTHRVASIALSRRVRCCATRRHRTHRVASIALSRRVRCCATRRHIGCVRQALIGRMLRGMQCFPNNRRPWCEQIPTFSTVGLNLGIDSRTRGGLLRGHSRHVSWIRPHECSKSQEGGSFEGRSHPKIAAKRVNDAHGSGGEAEHRMLLR